MSLMIKLCKIFQSVKDIFKKKLSSNTALNIAVVNVFPVRKVRVRQTDRQTDSFSSLAFSTGQNSKLLQ